MTSTSPITAASSTASPPLNTPLSSTASVAPPPALAVHDLRMSRVVYLAFLMDTTGSMGPHLRAVKDQIHTLATAFRDLGLTTQLAFVGYKDHCDGVDHFQVFPFTTDVAAFRRFVKAIPARGGGDTPEDVLGGLAAALRRLEWPTDKAATTTTNVLFHIGDAPPHGRAYFDGRDAFPDGHADDVPMDTIVEMMQAAGIQYFFGRINDSTDAMVAAIRQTWPNDVTVFDVLDPVRIAASVLSATVRSASRTSWASSCPSAASSSLLPPRGLVPPPPRRRQFSFSPTVPTWDDLPRLRGALLSYDEPASLVDLLAGQLASHLRPVTFRVAPHPFAYGSERVVYFAQEYHKHHAASHSTHSSSPMQDSVTSLGSAGSWIDVSSHEWKEGADVVYEAENMVAKAFVYRGGDNEADGRRYMQTMECYVAAAFLAREFNRSRAAVADAANRMVPPHKLVVLRSKVVRVGDTPPYTFYAWEKHYKAEAPHVKLTNNLGYVCKRNGDNDDDQRINEMTQLAVAFTHWTWHATDGVLMVVDLQGQCTDTALVLTDPAIHSLGYQSFVGGTNLGKRGMAAFCSSHRCNAVCRALGLPEP
ncbi:Aste57867_19632 [Aphanomyces stellatus]|uniref:Aste57867_19632 protein n=1 Tax=Aphanomyces stellatus TaxID=120398 RepID=A0A485LHM3_9STRA|nr:hypothetical protein As57867_019567 [Aphanomyces stellatus]VFT96332.1 Aste57867_19632 [Aphanomyces stellatus]